MGLTEQQLKIKKKFSSMISKEKKAEREKRKRLRESALNVRSETITITKKTGKRKVAYGYEDCVSKVNQTAYLETDINHLMKTMAPDEFAAYIGSRNQHRRAILGHDFSKEPSRQQAMNTVVELKNAFEELPDSIKDRFQNAHELCKFIDNPKNLEKMVALGMVTTKQLEPFTKEKTVQRQDLRPQDPTALAEESSSQDPAANK